MDEYLGPPSTTPQLRCVLTAQDWDIHRETVKWLYCTENKTLKELAKIMKQNYGFHATTRQYQRKFSEWRLRKNFSADEMEEVIRKRKERGDENRASAFVVRGRPIAPEKIDRYVKRRNINEDTLVSQRSPSATTPSAIDNYTPSTGVPATPVPSGGVEAMNHSPAAFPVGLLENLETTDQLTVRLGHLRCLWMHVQEYKTLHKLYIDRLYRKDVQRSLGNWAPRFLSEFRDVFDVLYPRLLDTVGKRVENLNSNQRPWEAHYLLTQAYSSLHVSPTNIGTLDSSVTTSLVDSFEHKGDFLSAQRTQEALLNAMIREHGPDHERTEDSMRKLIQLYDKSSQGLLAMIARLGYGAREYTQVIPVLHRAVLTNCKGLVTMLLQRGENPLTRDYLGRTALHIAVEQNSTDVIASLLDADADVNAADIFGRSALFLAAMAGLIQPAEQLLNGGASLEIKDKLGMSILAIAVKKNHMELASLLLRKGADVNAAPDEEPEWVQIQMPRIALQVASAEGHVELARMLLKGGADINMQFCGRTALQSAAEWGHIEVVGLLLENSAYVNELPKPEEIHCQIFEVMLDREANTHYELHDESRAWCLGGLSAGTALQAAAQNGHLEVVRLLLRRGGEANAKPVLDGKTALQAAAGSGHMKIVQLLLEKGADINAKPSDSGRTALQAAAEAGHLAIVRWLLERGADVNGEPAFDGKTALQAAAGNGCIDVVRMLLGTGAIINAGPGDRGRTAIQSAAENGHLDVARLLLERGANVNAGPARVCGRTALQAAAESGHLQLVRELLANGAEVNMKAGDSYGRTALQAAAEKGHLDVVQELLRNGACVEAEPRIGSCGHKTALQAAAASGNTELVRLLLAKGWEVNEDASEYFGRTALQEAARSGVLDMVRELLGAGAEANKEGSRQEGGTALQEAAAKGHEDVVRLLLEEGANADAEAQGFPSGKIAIESAYHGGHWGVVDMLLAKGAGKTK
ncbi:MAG: hypothetical protein M1840_007058 [Geoglossum simile]|nr:MAG: hypothetical protein M1840_007058 [Geoglossum simile]